MSRKVVASSPGKIILFGEHFVVHNSFAIAAAICRRATVSISESDSPSSIVYRGTKSSLTEDDGDFVAVKSVLRAALKRFQLEHQTFKVEIESTIPQNSGLGSSAAVSVAAAAAVARFFERDTSADSVLELANAGEQSVHGNPSGIDSAVSFTGGTILFKRGGGYQNIASARGVKFLVGYSGIERKTSELIGRVGEFRSHFPFLFSSLVDSVSLISTIAKDSLERGELKVLGAMMNLSQASLDTIGVSTRETQELIELILSTGKCSGAKITGAGGGGSIIALPWDESAGEEAVGLVSKRFQDIFLTDLSQEGVRFES